MGSNWPSLKTSRTGMLLVVALVAIVGAMLALLNVRRPQPSFKEAVAFVRSIHAFVESRTQQGAPPPLSVQLRELVDGGYITPQMARRFEGAQITLPTLPTGPSEPQPLERAMQQVLISLRLPDGRKTVMTADGSIHQSAR